MKCVPRRYGFTLLEILVVLFVAGLMTSFASLGIRSAQDGSFKQVSKNLFLQMQLANEDAVLLNTQYGLDIARGARSDVWQYHWLRYNESNETWHATNGEILKTGTLPPGMEMRLEIQDSAVEIGYSETSPDTSDTDLEEWPNIMFLSSGEITPFRLHISMADDSGNQAVVVLSSNARGRLEMNTNPL